MTRRGRGSTWPGRPSALPPDNYEAPPPVREDLAGGLVVDFRGEDKRQWSFDVGTLPMPGWHPLLAEALALRIGVSGDVKTLAGARDSWGATGRWARFLATVFPPVPTPDDLVRAHVEAFHKDPDAAELTRFGDMRELQLQFGHKRIRGRLPADAWDAFDRRLLRPKTKAVGGYSKGEFDRLAAAARADTARIVRRIRAGEQLVRQFRSDPGQLDPRQREMAVALTRLADTGEVPELVGGLDRRRRRAEFASNLFLTWNDIAPLMALLALVTERNGETLKELPAKHRILEGRAVELVIVKRRRGTKRWFESVTWEIGPKSRELHTAGGLYLLLLELTDRSRGFCGSSSAICFWRNGPRGIRGREEHYAPFESDLSYGHPVSLSAWAASRAKPVLADPRPASAAKQGKNRSEPGEKPSAEAPQPLRVTFNRIKTSADVRRTKQLGGHLPSSAKSNTAQVLFTNYLKDDESTREWAEEVMTEALADAEQAAWDAHARAVGRRGEPTVLPDAESAQDLEDSGIAPQTAREAAEGALDTGWTACEDHDHHPETGTACGDSFLACFHCGNCLVTRTHLPRLLALLKALGTLRERMSENAWWERYGPAWVAIRRDILAKFTPAEVDKARQQPLPDALLDLVEDPWDQP
ncbi:hypothetical protein ACFWRG_29945 [Micromonospora tulbaghiae]|uniref:Integrase n=2 Tax=Streptomyces TaxID=1883 RepID=A0A1E7LT67_9ACTN|nr:hypothetical protein [Streptomyces nanshensis]OEV19351.1 hypothetical protein AN221_17420 [Streptomyces nanshensis]